MNALMLVLVLAQQPSQPEDTVVLKPVVVTATRVAVPADMIASAVTVLRGAELTAKGVRTVAHALQSVPGVHVVETGSYGGQTAVFTRGGESDYTKVLVDGVPLNQPGGSIDLAHLTLDNVDRIEIVRGPASVLYGSDAMTGVIQVFTRTGQGAPQVSSELRAGTYGSTEAALDVRGSSPSVRYSARVSRFASDGLYPYNNSYRNRIASAQVHLTPDGRSDVTISYRYGNGRLHFPTDGTGAPVDSNQQSAERGPMFSVSAGRMFGDRLEARVSAGLREVRQLYSDDPDSPGQDGFWSRDYVRRATTGALVNWSLAEDVILSGGIEYEDERQRGRNEFTSGVFAFPDSIEVGRFSTGYLAQLLVNAGDFAITLGERVDDNSQFGTHATYRGGIVYRARSGFRVRASAGTGFKEPTFFENFARGFVRGNPDLEPERSGSWEVGVQRGGVSVTYFDQRFRDLIEFSPTPIGPDSVNYFNVGGALANGVEASVHTAVTDRLALSISYTWLHTRVLKSSSTDPDGAFVPGKPLLRRPTFVLAPELTAAFNERARITLGARWVGRRDDVGPPRAQLGSFARVNLSGEYTIGRIVLSGALENLFNDQAEEINGFRPRGRTIMLGVRVTMGAAAR